MQHQLDIFDDSRDVGLRNDLAQALRGGDTAAARRSAATLQAEFGDDAVLAPAALLIEHHEQQAAPAAARLDVGAVLQARRRLEGPLAAAATAVFGAADGAAWCTAQWRRLALQAGAIGWHADHAEAHAAALHLRGHDWAQAAQAVARIESWRRIPVPLLWMAQARWHGDGADAAWPLLAEALWLAPARAAALLPALADRTLRRLIETFEDRFDAGDEAQGHWAWLPVFALVERPLLAGPLALATPPTATAAAQAFHVVMALLRLERQGRHHDVVAQRARLQALSAPLFDAYMATR